MMNNMVLHEVAAREAKEWDTQAAMPAIWEIVHQYENAGLNIQNAESIVNWYVFLNRHNATTLEEFLQKFYEGTKKKDFYEFSRFCYDLYHQVHEKQLAEEARPPVKAIMRKRMEHTIEMEQLGDQCHKDPQNDYWQRRASMGAPDDGELPRAHTRLIRSYDSFEDFLAAHKEFDRHGANSSSKIATSQNGAARELHRALNASQDVMRKLMQPDFDVERIKSILLKFAEDTDNTAIIASIKKGDLERATQLFLEKHFALPE